MRTSGYHTNILGRITARVFPCAVVLVALCAPLWAGVLEDATAAISKQNYQLAIRLLESNGASAAPEALLLGRAYFQIGQFDKASDALERAVAADPKSSRAVVWLGRAYGMRAERANPFSAMGLARKTRDAFEAAVKLDPRNLEAVSDLFSYYLAAPGFLGGGIDRARALAETVKSVDPSEYAFLQAQLAEKEKDYIAAERNYLAAQAREPSRIGRSIDLATFYTRRGMTAKADAALAKAKAASPGAVRLLFDEANLLVRAQRNPSAARVLLRKYQASPRSDDDPAPYAVQQLLAKLEKLEKQ